MHLIKVEIHRFEWFKDKVVWLLIGISSISCQVEMSVAYSDVVPMRGPQYVRRSCFAQVIFDHITV